MKKKVFLYYKELFHPEKSSDSIYYYGTKNIYFLVRYFFAFYERIFLAF